MSSSTTSTLPNDCLQVVYQCVPEIKIQEPPLFSGYYEEDARDWLDKLEFYLECQKFSSNYDRALVLASRLDKLAQAWYMNLQDYIKGDFTLLKTEFLLNFVESRFQTNSIVDIREPKLESEQDWFDFEQNFAKYCKQNGFTDEAHKILLFKRAMPEHIQHGLELFNGGYKTVSQCAATARTVCNCLCLDTNCPYRTRKLQNSNKWEYSDTQVKVTESNKGKSLTPNKSPSSLSSAKSETQKPNVNSIHNSPSVLHTRSTQTKQKVKSKQKRKSRQKQPCINCRSNGHKTTSCKSSSMSTNSETQHGLSSKSKLNITSQFDLSYSSHIYVNFSNGVKLHTLIDTGANCNCISEAAFNRISERDRSNIKPTLGEAKSAGGAPLKIVGESVLSFKLGEGNFSVSVYVVDSLIVDFILGRNFLGSQGAVLDFSKNTIKLNSKYTLYMPHDVVVGPGREQILCVHLKGKIPNAVDGLVTSNSRIQSLGLFMANTLNTTSGTNIPIRILNPHKTSITIKKNTKVGTFAPLSASDLITPFDKTQQSQNPNVSHINHSNSNKSNHSANKSSANSIHHHNLSFEEARKILADTIDLSNSNLNDTQKEQLLDVLAKYREAFSLKGELGNCNLLKHEIPLKPDTRPIYQRPYRYSMFANDEARKHVSGLLEKGVIEPSTSPWSSPICIVTKPRSSPTAPIETRMTIDYRKLNENTIADVHPLPRFDDTLDRIGSKKKQLSLVLSTSCRDFSK